MAVYKSLGLNSKQPMLKVDNKENDFKTLVNEVYNGTKEKEVHFATEEDKNSYKIKKAPYTIAGELKDRVRNNANLIYRTLLFLDVDKMPISYEDLKNNLPIILEANFCLYPTISHGRNTDKKQTSARIVIELDRNINKEENAILINNVTYHIVEELKKRGFLNDYHRDESNETWSQAQGLYLKTTDNMKDSPITNCKEHYSTDNSLKVDEWLKKQGYETKKKNRTEYVKATGLDLSFDNFVKNSEPNYLAQLCLALVTRKVPIQKGGRNNWYRRVWYAVLQQSLAADDKRKIVDGIIKLNSEQGENALGNDEIMSIFRESFSKK